MTVEIVNVNWYLGQNPNEGIVTVKTERGRLLDAFSYGQDFSIGEQLEVEFSSLHYDLQWEVIFTENQEQKLALEQAAEPASYYCYGRILSINPIIADFGDLKINLGDWTNDERVMGEYIYWKIDRLDVIKHAPNT